LVLSIGNWLTGFLLGLGVVAVWQLSAGPGGRQHRESRTSEGRIHVKNVP